MEKIRNFLREKGFVLVLLACIAGAAATGLWAVRTVRDRLKENLTIPEQLTGREEYPGLSDKEADEAWQMQPGLGVAGKAENVPIQTPEPASGTAGQTSSAEDSGSGLSSAPAEAPQEPEELVVSAVPSCTQPVSGAVLQPYSGDELVYNETLGDWRTHNGIDYACAEGDSVFSPVSGKVTAVAQNTAWGTAVTVTDAEGREWKLCGLRQLSVQEGTEVSIGQQLGEAGSVECETALGPHIHMELRSGGRYCDPAKELE